MAAMPTPLAPAWINTLSPFCTLPEGGRKGKVHLFGFTFGLKHDQVENTEEEAERDALEWDLFTSSYPS